MDGLGVGWSRQREINPRLIYATGTGFGISGPDRDNLAMDMTIQAASGIMSVTGFPDGPPVKAGPTLVDFMGGIHLYAGIVTALYDRDRSGTGRLVEVAMQETVYPTLAASYDYYYRTGEIPPRTGNRQSGLNSAPYNVFPTLDGHVAIHVVTEAHFQNLLKAMGREDLADDPRFATNAARVAHIDETDALIEAWTRTLPKMEVFARTKHYRVPCAPVRTAPEVMNDPHMHERGMLEWIDHPELGEIVVPTSPLRLHGADNVAAGPSPMIGQHNAEIYGGWLGLSAAEIAELKEDGVICEALVCATRPYLPKLDGRSPSARICCREVPGRRSDRRSDGFGSRARCCRTGSRSVRICCRAIQQRQALKCPPCPAHSAGSVVPSW